MFGFTKEELRILRRLDTPKKIQKFLDSMPINYEFGGLTCFSPRQVLQKNRAHCVEGAVFAAAVLRAHGHKPLVVDLTTVSYDQDHVIAVFKQYGCWGAITKTNHAVLRYRDPVYKSIRELVMSYFNEYFFDKGQKTLRSYSSPVNLARFDKQKWMISNNHIWFIPEYLADVGHIQILTRPQISSLKKANEIEIKAGELTEWNRSGKKLF